VVICLEQGVNDLHTVQLMPLLPHHLSFSKIQSGLSSWYRPNRVVRDKGSVVVVIGYMISIHVKPGNEFDAEHVALLDLDVEA